MISRITFESGFMNNKFTFEVCFHPLSFYHIFQLPLLTLFSEPEGNILGAPPGYYEPEYCTQSSVVTSEYPDNKFVLCTIFIFGECEAGPAGFDY